jgi:hypothetical protein
MTLAEMIALGKIILARDCRPATAPVPVSAKHDGAGVLCTRWPDSRTEAEIDVRSVGISA